MQPIQIFGPTHLAALGVTAIVWLVLLFAVKLEKKWSRGAEISLAVALLSQWLVRGILARSLGYFNPVEALPLHLCDVAAILGGLALITKRQILIELTYFWGLAGTLNGLITPSLKYDYPHPEYFGFFLLHSGVVIAALHMTIAWKCYPRLKSILWAFLWINVYLIVAAIANALTGANYAFLRERPQSASLLDAMPAPPWHLLVLEPFCLTLFGLLYLPFCRKVSSSSRMTGMP